MTVIVTPIAFRGLDEDWQFRLVRRFPFMADWQVHPTLPFNALPTIAANNDSNPLALLATPIASAATGTAVVQVPTATPFAPTATALLSTASGQGNVLPTQPVPTLVPTEIPSPTPIIVPLSFHSNGYKWVPQTWNNCGAANLTQAMQPFGWQGTQAEAAAYLKPNKEDKNVSPWQMINYVNSVSQQTDAKALWRVAGHLDLVKALVSQGFSVIMETGFSLPSEGWMGHYLTVIGYDNGKGLLYGLDTYLGDGTGNIGYPEKFDDLDTRWQQFNRLYIVIYPKAREQEVARLLGPDADVTYNAQHALNVARSEATQMPNNQFAWLFGPYEAYYNTGNYAGVLNLVNISLQTTTDVEETFYWRAMVEAAQGKTAQAVNDFKRVLNYNPNFTPATDMLAQVQAGSFKPPLVNGAGR